MMSVEQMLKDAVESGVRDKVQEVRSKLFHACLVEPCYETPFGTTPGVDEKIDEIVALLMPSITSVENNRVYRRMASTLRGTNDKHC